MNKKIEEIKRSRWVLEYENMLASPSVKEISVECQGVNLHIELIFISAFGRNEKEFDLILTPTDRAYFHRECMNKDCTGFGF